MYEASELPSLKQIEAIFDEHAFTPEDAVEYELKLKLNKDMHCVFLRSFLTSLRIGPDMKFCA